MQYGEKPFFYFFPTDPQKSMTKLLGVQVMLARVRTLERGSVSVIII